MELHLNRKKNGEAFLSRPVRRVEAVREPRVREGKVRIALPCSIVRGALITLTCDRFRIQVDAAGLRHRHSHSVTRIALVKKHSAIFSSKPSELQGSLHRQTDSASTSWIHSPAGVFPCFGTNAHAAWARCTRLGATGDSGSPPLCMQSLVRK